MDGWDDDDKGLADDAWGDDDKGLANDGWMVEVMMIMVNDDGEYDWSLSSRFGVRLM